MRKIVIIGGGTAGWMTAAYLAKYHGSENVTVVESPTIPIIGVGESVTPHVRDFFEEIGMVESDWMKETGAIHKYANKFINWCGTNDESYFSFNYTTPANYLYKDVSKNIANEDFVVDTSQVRTIDILNHFVKNNVYKRFDEYFCPQFHYMENNVSPYKDNEYLLNQIHSHAHHINAELMGTYIRTKITPNITNIIAEVVKVNTQEENISSIELDNGSVITADWFIDCTGFSRVLVNALGWKTKAYDHPIDSAWVCPTDYDDPETEMVNFTNTVAEPYGWRFNLALYHRMGNGYCYSSKHVSDEDAKEYFLKQIKTPKKEPRLIKWKPERLETFAKGNCVAVGLTCGFVEPLEANALYTIVTSIRRLHEVLNENDYKSYNNKMAHAIDDIADFILVHYTLSPRTDTKFWTDMQTIGKADNHAALVIDKIYDEKNSMLGASTGYTMFPDYMWIQLALHWNIEFNDRNKSSKADKILAKMQLDFDYNKHRYISSLCENNYTWHKNNIFKDAHKELSVENVIDQIGGLDLITSIGKASNNKYLINAQETISEQLNSAHILELQKSLPLNILEIGTGAGFFPYISQMYGHNVQSCDGRHPDSRYEQGYELLNINPKHYLVYKNVSVNNLFEQKFDLVVSFRSTVGTSTWLFPPHQDIVDVWGVSEWKFFLKDCSKNLLKTNNSIMYFQCNKGCNLPPYVGMNLEEISIWGSKELGEFFLPYQVDPRKNIFRITKKQIDSL